MDWLGDRARERGRRRRGQRGNALVFALLGLLVSALGAIGVIQSSRLQAKREAGTGEATILEALRAAANDAIFDSLTLIQGGAAFGRAGVSVAPQLIAGELVWSPSVQQLASMGYLPQGWTAVTSTLNQAPYTIQFRRVPAACSTTGCNVEGQVVLAGALRSGGSASDGALIGPILARLGADAGVSLPMDPTHIKGFGGTWSVDNPVAGQPAGVVAVRVGTTASALGAYVRIGDTRNPSLHGSLTVAGDTVFGDGSTRSEFHSSLQVDGQLLALQNAAGTPCVILRPNGIVDIECSGLLQANTGVFRNASGASTSIAATGLTTPGRVSADDGVSTPSVELFAASDPNAMVVKAGDLFVRNSAGSALMRVAANGDLSVGNDLVADGVVQGRRLALSTTVNEGDGCQAGQVAMLPDGVLATCQSAHFRVAARYASLGAACGTSGSLATDAGNADTLICKGGYYASVSSLMSPRVYMAGFQVHNGDFVSAATALPNGCPATAGPVPAQATIVLLPQSDAGSAGNPVLNRNATWTGQGWTISLVDGAGAATSSTAVAEIYCLYP